MAHLDHLLQDGSIGNDNLRTIQNFESILTEKGFTTRYDGNKCILDDIQERYDHFYNLFEG